MLKRTKREMSWRSELLAFSVSSFDKCQSLSTFAQVPLVFQQLFLLWNLELAHNKFRSDMFSTLNGKNLPSGCVELTHHIDMHVISESLPQSAI